MATTSASLFAALDGVVDPMVGNWHFPYFNDEMGDAVSATHDTDVMLFGRVTYDSFAGAWPEREAAGGEDVEFAKRLGDMRKVVVSRSPLAFTWRNSEQLQGDLVEAVAALKNDSSIRRIGLSGSVSVVRQLLDADLLDELHLFVHPATAGSGLRLFDDGAPARHLNLISATPFQTGVVHLVSAPDPNPPTGTYDEAKQSLPQERSRTLRSTAQAAPCGTTPHLLFTGGGTIWPVSRVRPDPPTSVFVQVSDAAGSRSSAAVKPPTGRIRP